MAANSISVSLNTNSFALRLKVPSSEVAELKEKLLWKISTPQKSVAERKLKRRTLKREKNVRGCIEKLNLRTLANLERVIIRVESWISKGNFEKLVVRFSYQSYKIYKDMVNGN